jgi:hypothetical protein
VVTPTVPKPTIEHPRDAITKVTTGAICGFDLLALTVICRRRSNLKKEHGCFRATWRAA